MTSCSFVVPNFAQRMNLGATKLRVDLSSTEYVLANPGVEYLVLQPSEIAELFAVTLEAGAYDAEWYSMDSCETMEGGTVTVPSDGSISFTAPFTQAGPAILYLKQEGG